MSDEERTRLIVLWGQNVRTLEDEARALELRARALRALAELNRRRIQQAQCDEPHT